MPKKQQRDFKKVKEKGYGKKKQASNVVKTSFKTRSLVMPYQKVADQTREDRVEVTNRNLSLTEIMVKVPHHNAKVRRDALIGLK
jgi:pre-rRNA-processing protein IPI1